MITSVMVPLGEDRGGSGKNKLASKNGSAGPSSYATSLVKHLDFQRCIRFGGTMSLGVAYANQVS